MHDGRRIAIARKMVAPAHPETHLVRAIEGQRENFGPEFFVDIFVGVERQAPAALCRLEGELLLFGVTRPRTLDQPDRKALLDHRRDDRDGAVGRTGIDDDDLTAETQAFQATPNRHALILADDERRDLSR